jgi:peptidoglycan-associated lipoprotein
MKFIKWSLSFFSIVILVGCSSKNGLNSLGMDSEQAGYGEISQTSIDYFSENVGDTILFSVNESTLRDDAIQTLNSQSIWLTKNSSAPITIEGHADEQGTREYNLALGARRATAVRNYLVSQGVQESRLSIVTYGKERPIEVCSQERCWSKNRRSITVVSGGLGN